MPVFEVTWSQINSHVQWLIWSSYLKPIPFLCLCHFNTRPPSQTANGPPLTTSLRNLEDTCPSERVSGGGAPSEQTEDLGPSSTVTWLERTKMRATCRHIRKKEKEVKWILTLYCVWINVSKVFLQHVINIKILTRYFLFIIRSFCYPVCILHLWHTSVGMSLI